VLTTIIQARNCEQVYLQQFTESDAIRCDPDP
jgi:hypothetical protein